MSEIDNPKRIGPAEEPARICAHRAADALPPFGGEASGIPESAPVAESPSRSIHGAGSAVILLLVTVVVAGLLLIATHGGRTEYGRRTADNASSFYMGPVSMATAGTPVTPGQKVAAVFASSPRAAAAALGQPVAVGARDASKASAVAAGHRAQASDDIPVVVYLFNYDSNNVPENEQLTELAAELSASGRDVAIVAYTDPQGSAAYNQRLSERRAAAISDYLVAHGVDRQSITSRGAGATDRYPTAALDRRAVITPQ